jgi:hypothetical protein
MRSTSSTTSSGGLGCGYAGSLWAAAAAGANMGDSSALEVCCRAAAALAAAVSGRTVTVFLLLSVAVQQRWAAAYATR